MKQHTFSTPFMAAVVLLGGLLCVQCNPEEIAPDDNGGELGGGLGNGGEEPEEPTAAELADAFIRESSDALVYYPFGGNADNVLAAEYAGTVDGASLIADRHGNPEAAYSFDGSSTIDFGGNPIPAGTFSLSFWINIPAADIIAGESYRFLSARETCSVGDFVDMAYSNTEANPSRIGVEIRGDSEGLGSTASVGTNNVPTDAWVHAVVVVDQAAGESRMYINGAWQATHEWDPTLTRPTNAAASLGIATSPCVNTVNAVIAFQGGLDDLALFGRVLTEEEISLLAEEE